MKFSLSSLAGLSAQALQDLGGQADDLARTGNEGAREIALVTGQALADEISRRRGKP